MESTVGDLTQQGYLKRKAKILAKYKKVGYILLFSS
jgi:hypothetical protein